MSYFSKNEKNEQRKGKQAEPQLPAAPQLPQAAVVQPPRLSHRAASVAHEMERLEADLEAANLRAVEMENRAKVAEDVCRELKSELAHLRNERDYFHDKYTEVVSRLKAAGSIIVDVVHSLDEDGKKQKPNQEMLDKAIKALQAAEATGAFPADAEEPEAEPAAATEKPVEKLVPEFIDKR